MAWYRDNRWWWEPLKQRGEMSAEVATVGVVVVNYNGGELTLECLHSLVRTAWPAARLRIVLVDNASTDGVVARVRDQLPVVQVVQQPTNDGFGAGCNAGIRVLDGADFVALVNNDAYVEPNWLAPLVDALLADPGLGATCPKILFAGRFRDVELRSATSRRGFGDRRDLGVFLSGARVDGVDVWSRVQLVDGTWGLEPDAAAGGEWTGTVTHLRVPRGESTAATVSFLLAADGPRAVSLRAGGETVEHTVGIEPAWFDVAATGDGIDVINNVGTELLPGGFGVDRGFLEPDEGQFDEPAEVFGVVRRGSAAPAGVPRRRRPLRRGPLRVLRGPRALVAGHRTRLAVPHGTDLGRPSRPRRHQRTRLAAEAVLRRTQPPPRPRPPRHDACDAAMAALRSLRVRARRTRPATWSRRCSSVNGRAATSPAAGSAAWGAAMRGLVSARQKGSTRPD